MNVDIVNSISALIGSLGFPIVAYFMMTRSMKEERELHKQEVDELRKVIENNTVTLERISTIIEKE